MSQAVIAADVGYKVNRVISSSTTVNSNCYAVVSYSYSSTTVTIGAAYNKQQLFNKYFGPGQSIPSTITISYAEGSDYGTNTFSLSSGVEFINSI